MSNKIKKFYGNGRSQYLFLKAKEMRKANIKNIRMHLRYLNRLSCIPELNSDQINTIYHMALYNFKGWKRQRIERADPR